MRRLVLLVVGALIVSACGGGLGELDEAVDGGDVFDTPSATNEDGGFDTGGGEAGPVTLTADPSKAYVEADGERFEYDAVGAVHYSCEIDDEQVRINFQFNGPSLLIQGSKLEGEWTLNLTATVEDNDIQYDATLPGEGSLGLDDGQLSYEGPIDRVENRDITNPTVVDAKLAVNCMQPEGQPTVVIDGTEYVVSMIGADSVRCEVSDEAVIVQVNRLTSDDTNIDIGVEAQEGGWFGHVSVTTPSGRFGAKGAPNPVGLTVDGSTVTYEGTFEGDSGDVEGSLVLTCP